MPSFHTVCKGKPEGTADNVRAREFQERQYRHRDMQTTAQLNNLRIAPRKVRLVAFAIKGMDVLKAESQLNLLAKRAAGPLGKLLRSAVANAENNLSLLKENLYIKDLVVNEGVKIKRFKPRAMGQAGLIQKKTSHIKIILEEKIAGLKTKSEPKVLNQEPEGESRGIQERQKKPTTETKREVSKKSVFSGIKDVSRKFFRRKSI